MMISTNEIISGGILVVLNVFFYLQHNYIPMTQ